MKIERIERARGTMSVPGDKSISHRSIMLGALADGITRISGFLPGADCLATIDCFRKMGVRVEQSSDTVIVYGVGLYGLEPPTEGLYTANSGTTTRLISGILSGQEFESHITGDSSILKRPMSRITTPLRRMGADITGDFCPLTIRGGKLKGIHYTSPVASAQVKSAVLLAGLYAEGETVFEEPEKSRDHTERMLGAMGADIESLGNVVKIRPARSLNAAEIKVPGDISSAAFFMVLAAILHDSEITIENVGINDTRTGIIDVLVQMKADICVYNKKEVMGEPVADIRVRSSSLIGTCIGGSIIPRLIDEIPIIAVAAAFAEGKTVIADAAELKVKESNRIKAIVDELQRCGVQVQQTDDGMIITGGKKLIGADFKTYGDHRMAMSLAILAQGIEGECSIDDAECVDVSYPDFFKTLYKL